MCLADTRLFLPGLNLAYTDRASMAASTEVRVPFVDPVVVRAAFSIPGRQKIDGRQAKVALKEAAEAWLPKEIVHRPKASFGAPLRAWVATRPRATSSTTCCVRGELVDPGFAAAATPLHQLDRRDRAGRQDRVQADLAAADARALVPQRAQARACRRNAGPGTSEHS